MKTEEKQEKQEKLTINEKFQSLPDISPETLQQEMLKSIVLLESSLFSQAGQEHARIARNRELMKFLENELFSSKFFSLIAPRERVRLYEAVIESMKVSLNFLNDLHNNVAVGLDTVNQVKILSELTSKNTENKEKIDMTTQEGKEIKKMLLDILKEKTSE